LASDWPILDTPTTCLFIKTQPFRANASNCINNCSCENSKNISDTALNL
jgi:hypothetical protein